MSAQPNPAKSRISILLGLLLVAAIVVIVAIAVSSGGDDKKSSSASKTSPVTLTGIPQSGSTLGKEDAPALIVEFVDPQCPYCRDFEQNEMEKIVNDAIRPGRAKMQLRVLTFLGPDSAEAARVWEAAGFQNKMFDVAAAFYANQGEENSGYVTDKWLKDTLGGIDGFDFDKALNEAADPRITAALGEAKSLASRYGVDSTPTLLVGKDINSLEKVDPTSEAVLKAVGKIAPPKQ